MSDNISPTGLVIDGAIFIDEMLSYVHHGYYGISRVSLIPFVYRNTYRQIIDFMFHQELGDAIVKRLAILPWDHDVHLNAFATRVGFRNSPDQDHLAYLVRFHWAVNLTDEDFRRDDQYWSACLVDWFALLAAVCFHLERNGDCNELLRAFIVAGEILCHLMSGRPFLKMTKLRQFARTFTSGNPSPIVN